MIVIVKALNFLSLKNILARLKKIYIYICINVFCQENNLVYPVHISDEKFENCMDLLTITDGNKSDYVYIKDFNNKTKCRTQNTFQVLFTMS